MAADHSEAYHQEHQADGVEKRPAMNVGIVEPVGHLNPRPVGEEHQGDQGDDDSTVKYVELVTVR